MSCQTLESVLDKVKRILCWRLEPERRCRSSCRYVLDIERADLSLQALVDAAEIERLHRLFSQRYKQEGVVMTSGKSLEALRAELDTIDKHLLDTLRARIECCIYIAQYKREHGIAMMQPHRINIVQERAARYAAEHGISTEFLRRLYDLIIAETCKVEDRIISAAPGE